MALSEQFRNTKWGRILLFYAIALCVTYVCRKLPNLLNLLLAKVTDISFPFNYNHGIAVLVVAIIFYRCNVNKNVVSLTGNNKIRSLLFPAVLFTCYTAFGINNNQGIDKHLWALMFCGFAFIYNLMEEYAWRGYLTDSLHPLNFWLKSIISGTLWAAWHLLVFQNFDQYHGFGIFLIFCIVFSFILTFAVLRTRSIIVAAAMHTFIIQMNIAAIICPTIFVLLLMTWNKKLPGKQKAQIV